MRAGRREGSVGRERIREEKNREGLGGGKRKE